MRVAFALVTLSFAVILTRLFYWQILQGDTLRVQAAAQYNLTFDLPATRGAIVTSDGYPLAMSVPSYLVYAQPNLIENPGYFAHSLASLFPIDESELLSRLTEPNRVWVPIQHKVDADTVETLKKSGLEGIGYEHEASRFYPEASMAAHLLGFVGSDANGLDTGYFGVEGHYDRELRGKDGTMSVEKDVRGAPILIAGQQRIEPQDGRSIELFLDRTIEHIVYKRLKEGIEKYGAKEGNVIVMEPETGGILAAASLPDYDPGRYTQFDRALYKNPVVAASYEPGSTFKVLVMSAALNEQVVTADTLMQEDGPVKVGDYSIRTWNNEYHGPQTMAEVIQHSSNVGMVFVEQKLGRERLLSYIKKFGFGEPTGVDLEDETSPQLRDDNEWRDIDLATASFGQGIAVTPLQMVRAVSAIANGGFLMKPLVAKAIRDPSGKSVENKPKRITRIIDEKAAKTITEIMVNAVDNGEAKWAKPKGYRIAGKTGTAQIPVAGHYDESKTIASFVGFAPADDPAFVMLVTLREPTSSPWGSETAAPLFFAIARDIFAYKNIPASP